MAKENNNDEFFLVFSNWRFRTKLMCFEMVGNMFLTEVRSKKVQVGNDQERRNQKEAVFID